MSTRFTIHARDTRLSIGARTLLMGILNVTPDSFSDGGLFHGLDIAVTHAKRLADEGADILDVGGESTRPGAEPVDADEEVARVLPVIVALMPVLSIPISIDTYKSVVADRTLSAGACIVNDVWGLQRDADMARVVAAHGAAVIVMHNREKADESIDIVADIRAFLQRSIDIALAAGVREDQIAVDPGIGFGKTFHQNLDVIARLHELRELGFPILLGASRKSFIGHILGAEPPDRLYGTLAAHVMGAMRGADIIRAHDIAQHRDALRVANAITAAAP